MFIKVTFFLLFLQLFRPSRKIRFAIYGGLAFTILFYVMDFIVDFVSDTPRPGETWISHEEFNPVENIGITSAIWLPTVGMVIDLYILCLPLYCVSTLQLSMRRKLMAASVFFTGILWKLFKLPA